MSTSFETPVDQSMTAALVSALEDLTSAVSSQSESLDGLGAGPDSASLETPSSSPASRPFEWW